MVQRQYVQIPPVIEGGIKGGENSLFHCRWMNPQESIEAPLYMNAFESCSCSFLAKCRFMPKAIGITLPKVLHHFINITFEIDSHKNYCGAVLFSHYKEFLLVSDSGFSIYISLIYDVMDFNEAWEKIVDYTRSHGYVETLVKGIRNDIYTQDGNEIVATSHSPKRAQTQRHLKRIDFEAVWSILESARVVSSDDIDSALRGRRLIILALLARSLNLKYDTKPVRIYM